MGLFPNPLVFMRGRKDMCKKKKTICVQDLISNVEMKKKRNKQTKQNKTKTNKQNKTTKTAYIYTETSFHLNLTDK